MNRPKKQPWPTKAAMQQIYQEHLWGGEGMEFYSGDGSHDERLVKPYVQEVSDFLKHFTKPISVCDLGCGDFNVGRQLVSYCSHFHAIDIVPELIEHNRSAFQHENLTFYSLDIAKDALPKADCAIVRQVMQHLSNAEVKAVVEKLSAFKYIILTEHIPTGEFIPNADIISGQGIRLKKKSGVDILAAPFHFQAKREEEWLRIPLEAGKGQVLTTFLEVG